MSTATPRHALRNIFLLVAAQAFLGAQMPMIFTIGGLAGQTLAPNACLATLPISVIVLASMTTAPWLSPLMQRHGRRAGFLIGAGAGALAGVIGAWALREGSFALFLVAAWFTGIYMSAQGFYRFAAADTAPPELRPKAISWVMAGGLIAALIGPQLVKFTAEAMTVPFLGTYLAIVAINLLGALLFLGLDIPPPPPPAEGSSRPGTRLAVITRPRVAVAMICAMVSYALMNLVMTSTPLAVVGCGFGTADAADIVSSHVVAMFLPSFFTGNLIARFGAERVIMAGLVLLALAGGTALAGVELTNFFAALILLGLGWNFGFIGATAMLTEAIRPEERGLVQGLNDMFVFGGVTVASLASGALLNCMGGSAVEGWNMVNLAMLPFLTLAGAALLWLKLHPHDEEHPA